MKKKVISLVSCLVGPIAGAVFPYPYTDKDLPALTRIEEKEGAIFLRPGFLSDSTQSFGEKKILAISRPSHLSLTDREKDRLRSCYQSYEDRMLDSLETDPLFQAALAFSALDQRIFWTMRMQCKVPKIRVPEDMIEGGTLPNTEDLVSFFRSLTAVQKKDTYHHLSLLYANKAKKDRESCERKTLFMKGFLKMQTVKFARSVQSQIKALEVLKKHRPDLPSLEYSDIVHDIDLAKAAWIYNRSVFQKLVGSEGLDSTKRVTRQAKKFLPSP